LFVAIEAAYDGQPSLFDNITPDDLIIAFFPCIYFTGFTNPRYYTLENNNYVNLSTKEKFDAMITRSRSRQYFFELVLKLSGALTVHRKTNKIYEKPIKHSIRVLVCENSKNELFINIMNGSRKSSKKA